MIKFKNVFTIIIIVITVSSCGVISKTRYGNGYNINLSIQVPVKFIKPKLTEFKSKHIVSIDIHSIPFKKTSSIEINKIASQSIATSFNDVWKYPFPSHPKNNANDLQGLQFSSFEHPIRFIKTSIPDKHKNRILPEDDIKEQESTGMLILKILLTIILFATIAVLYATATLVGISIFLLAKGSSDFSIFRFFYDSINSLAQISFKGIWRSWKREWDPDINPPRHNRI